MFRAAHRTWAPLEDWAAFQAVHQAWEPPEDWAVFRAVHQDREPQMEVAEPRVEDQWPLKIPGPVIPLARAQRAATHRPVGAMLAASIQARRPMAKVTEAAAAWDPWGPEMVPLTRAPKPRPAQAASPKEWEMARASSPGARACARRMASMALLAAREFARGTQGSSAQTGGSASKR